MQIDPSVFLDGAISDETAIFNQQLQAMLLALPKTSSATPEHIRAERRSGTSVWGPVVHSEHARDVVIDGPGGPLTLRIIEVGNVNGVYLHVHGGGWVLGAADLSDVANEAMAREAGVAVVSVDYRLAPEHPYPAAPDDCLAGAAWLIDHAMEEFGTDRLTIGGESAGANLAAATLLAARDDLGYSGWRGANLVYGAFFPAGTPSVRSWSEDGLVLDADTMAWFNDHYRPDGQDVFDEPSYAPLYGSLHDLPPALFTVGTRDPLLDDTLFMAMRWVAAGHRTELEIKPGGVHGFDAFPITIGIEARRRMHAFIAEVVG
jgi:acetyl esterase